LVSFPASALLIDNNTYTTDTATGLDWWDWNLTEGRSYDDVSSQFGQGGEFEGWRYATLDDVTELYTHAGANAFNEWSLDNYDAVDTLIDLLGGKKPFSNSETKFAWAMYGTPDDNGWVSTLGPQIRSDSLANFDLTGSLNHRTSGGSNPFGNGLGNALVRNTSIASIPEPSVMLLLSAGLLLPVFRRTTIIKYSLSSHHSIS